MSFFNYRLIVKYAEALIISIIFITIGYAINSHDPCFIDNKINIALFVITVLTLFFGFAGLISFLIVYISAFFLFYETFALYKMLELLMLGLILYLFHYLWETKTQEEHIKNRYLTQRLEENTNAFYTLKTSYDQLEKSHITKPFGLFESLEKIINITRENPNRAELEFLKFLKQLYQVRKSFLLYYKKGKIEKLSQLEKNDIFENDILIKRAILKMTPVYVDFNEKTDTKYLAVIPVATPDEIALLVIEEISFNAFNKEVLLQICVIFTYFVQSVQKERFMEFHQCRRPYFNDDFTFELCKLQNIKDLYNISSSALSLKSTDLKYMTKLLSIIQKEKRALDLIQTLTVNKKRYVIIIVFVFSDRLAAEKFLSRVKKIMKEEKDYSTHAQPEDFEYKIADIEFNKFEKLLG